MTKQVAYCENSTITEAYAVLRGLPGPIIARQADALIFQAQKSFGKFQNIPSIVLSSQSDSNMIPPHWSQQITWGEDNILARIGHRYLSIHFVKRTNNRYQTYGKTLLPHIQRWLDVFHKFYDDILPEESIGQVGFGYINTFTFPVTNFDISQYFRVNVGIEHEIIKHGLNKIATQFQAYDEKDSSLIAIDLLTEVSPVTNELNVRTTTSVDKTNIENCYFTDKEKILEQILTAKKTAKETFFKLATAKTCDLMKVKYESASS